MDLILTCQRPVTPAATPHTRAVAQMFGLGLDESEQTTLIPPVTVPLTARSVVFVTGASGSGKSTLLGLIERELAAADAPAIVSFESLTPPSDGPVVDAFGEASLDRVLRWLALAGLNEARVMLRTPGELSDGQRYRLRLARLMQHVEAGLAPSRDAAAARDHSTVEAQQEDPAVVVLADEFGATLDRQTARILATQVRKWTYRWPVCFVAATSHDDLLESLEPDVLIEKPLSERIDVLTRDGEHTAPPADDIGRWS